MIPINESRVGNYVELYGTIAKIQRADFSGEGIAIDEGNPIKLTEEWLEKLGFYEDGETNYNSKYYSICLNDYKYCFAYADFRGDWGIFQEYTDSPFVHDNERKHFISCGIKYLHELQNLWIDLKTDIELTIKL